jgi:hypothetical protein
VKNGALSKIKGLYLSMLQNLRLKNAKNKQTFGRLVPCEGLSLLDIETYFLLEQLSL